MKNQKIHEKIRSRWNVIFSLVAMIATNAQSQELPYLRDIKSRCSVTLDFNTNIYTYRYSFLNGISSVGKIGRLELDISRNATSIAYDTIGLQYVRGYIEASFRRIFPGFASRIVPIGFPVMYRHWISEISNGLTATFFGTPLISPGQTLDSLIITSKALPGVRKFFAEPYLEEEVWSLITPSLEDTSATALTVQRSDSIKETLRFRGLTIGPTAPPSNFVALAFLDTLLSYTRQSAELGWLGRNRDDDCDDDERPDDGVVRNIENRLQRKPGGNWCDGTPSKHARN